MLKKITMHSKLLDAFMNMAMDDDLSVCITTGESHTDYNGDRQVDVLLEFSDEDAEQVHIAITAAINATFGLNG